MKIKLTGSFGLKSRAVFCLSGEALTMKLFKPGKSKNSCNFTFKLPKLERKIPTLLIKFLLYKQSNTLKQEPS